MNYQLVLWFTLPVSGRLEDEALPCAAGCGTQRVVVNWLGTRVLLALRGLTVSTTDTVLRVEWKSGWDLRYGFNS